MIQHGKVRRSWAIGSRANLPARSFHETASFYGALGFSVVFRNEGWTILHRGDLEIELFPHPDLDPTTSWFSACVRVAMRTGYSRVEQLRAAGRWQPAHDRAYRRQPRLRMFMLVEPTETCER